MALSCALMGMPTHGLATLNSLSIPNEEALPNGLALDFAPGIVSELAQNSSRPASVSGLLVAADDNSGEDQPSERSVSAPTIKTPDIGGTGVLDYSYDLDLPKFHGIVAKLSLSYSSARKSKTGGLYQGWLGYGWGLGGFDVIERSRKNGSVPSFSNDWDVFQLNGDELVDCRDNDDGGLVLRQEEAAETDAAGNHAAPSCLATTSADGDAKATRYESYLKIIRKGEQNYPSWQIFNREGTKMVLESLGVLGNFSGTNNEDDVAKRARWLVNTVTDVHGNAVAYEYDCVDKATVCYPKKISYTGTVIHFELENRPQDIVVANGRGLTTIKKRIKLIWVETDNNDPVAAWKLVYGTTGTASENHLQEIRRFGSKFSIVNGDISSLPGALAAKKTKLTYAIFNDFTAGEDVGGSSKSGDFDLVDVDSDGIQEVFQTIHSPPYDEDTVCDYAILYRKSDGLFDSLNLSDKINCYYRIGYEETQGPGQGNVLRFLPRYNVGHFGDDLSKTQLLFRDASNSNSGQLRDSRIEWEAIFKKSGNSFDVEVNRCNTSGVTAISDNSVKAYPQVAHEASF